MFMFWYYLGLRVAYNIKSPHLSLSPRAPLKHPSTLTMADKQKISKRVKNANAEAATAANAAKALDGVAPAVPPTSPSNEVPPLSQRVPRCPQPHRQRRED